jgi:hypothetical protein
MLPTTDPVTIHASTQHGRVRTVSESYGVLCGKPVHTTRLIRTTVCRDRAHILRGRRSRDTVRGLVLQVSGNGDALVL